MVGAATVLQGRPRILVGTGTCGLAAGAGEVVDALRRALEEHSVEADLVQVGCIGLCYAEPLMEVTRPGAPGVFYANLTPERAAAVVRDYLAGDDPRPDLALGYRDEGDMPGIPGIPRFYDLPIMKPQVRVALRNCGNIDPADIDEYLAVGGYEGLRKALAMTPEGVIAEMKRSGLRGRGGAGFPTGLKWQFCHDAPGVQKYIICNADEGDPGAFMDRAVLEGDPHAVLEGMLIGAYAMGANEGYIYVRAEYPLAIERLRTAIAQMEERGLLGDNVLASNFACQLKIKEGAGAFVCGEETALIASIEGERGMPRPRPPYPAQSGLWGKPTNINNVETWANVSAIMAKGADWFAAYGTEKSRGTKTFALAGKIRRSGLIEVPMGISLGEIIYEIGGGVPGGKEFKAVQLGGPSGGCVPKEHLNVKVEYETLQELGAIVGSGGMIVMDDDSCMVDVARYFLNFSQLESCGKCIQCRWGTRQMLNILEDIVAGRGREGDIELLEELGAAIKNGSLCALGGTAPNPVLSTIRYFRDEYEAHIHCHRCEAGVCPELFAARCSNACPAHVQVPGYVSLIAEGRFAEALRLHRERNPLASVCGRVCFHPCEGKCVRATVDDPVAIRSLKRFMTEQETDLQIPEVRQNAANARRKVAIIGAGPAGLSCAYFLARLGYRPVVFEKETAAGGMLVQAIPAYRLPRPELQREIGMIESLGVTIETGKALGRDFTLTSLKDAGYEAVFLGTGAPDGLHLTVPGEAGPGVSDALAFLRDYNLKGAAQVGKRVVVIGGGNSAIDAARTARRLGAERVTVLYRRERFQMPAWADEVFAACEEDIEIMSLTVPREVVRNADGAVRGVRCASMVLAEYDRSGRRGLAPSDAPNFMVSCDQVIVAVGQSLDVRGLLGDLRVETRSGWITTDPSTAATSLPWLFAGGDAATGPSSVIEAIGAGERGAVAIDTYLTGTGHAFWRPDVVLDTRFDPGADPVTTPRAQSRFLDPGTRACSFAEVELPWTADVALAEAKRCLRCDYGKGVKVGAAARTEAQGEVTACHS